MIEDSELHRAVVTKAEEIEGIVFANMALEGLTAGIDREKLRAYAVRLIYSQPKTLRQIRKSLEASKAKGESDKTPATY